MKKIEFKKINRILAIALAMLMLGGALASFSGCSDQNDEKTTVICTVFPVYDWVRQVVGEDNENIEVKLLLANGADIHSYQATAADVLAIRKAELVVRVGYGDAFIDDILKSADRVRDLCLIRAEGMTLREISASSHDEHDHTEGEEHDHEIDEHIWLSLKNASASVTAILSAICELDRENAETYTENARKYKEKLTSLDSLYAEAVSKSAAPRILFADRFPFVYMTGDYGIEHTAAFHGCSTEADATFDTIKRLAECLDSWDLDFISVTESADSRLAESVKKASKKKNAEVIVFDSMQSVTSKNLSEGKTYLQTMEKNLVSLKRALGVE